MSSAANYAAVQAKSNAPKSDEASPFALLVGTVAPKDTTKDTNRSPSKDTSSSNDKGADDKSAKTQDDQATQTAASSAKPDKSDKNANKDDTKVRGNKASNDKAAGDKATGNKDSDQQVSASDSQTQDQQAAQQASVAADQQNLPSLPPAAQTAVPADGEADDLAVDTATPAAAQPQTGMPAPAGDKPDARPGTKASAQAGTPAKTPVKPPVTAQTPALADDNSEDDSDTQPAETENQAAPTVSTVAATAALTRNTTDIQTATAVGDQPAIAQNSGAQNTGKTIDAPPPDEEAVSDAAPAEGAPKSDAAKNDTTVPTGKSTGIKNTPAKARTAQADTIDKTDTAKTDASKSETPKAAPEADISNAASTPKTAPQPTQQAILAVNTIAAPQAQSSAVATATPNPHVQVSADTAPDLPSLAVAIVGKSQAGAKQFDIRLDPAELGRVEVRLSIDATGKASAHLSADQPQTLSLLQKDAPVLARALREAGLDVSQDGLNFSLRQQNDNQSGNAGNNGRRGSSRSFSLNASINNIDATTGSAAYRSAANGRVDIRV